MRSLPAGSMALALAIGVAACGGGGGGIPVDVAILEPSASGAFTQSAQEVRLGGTVSRAGFLQVHNLTDGGTSPGYVVYVDGRGTWMADVYGLAMGPNVLEAVADHDGTGRHTAGARIVVTRVAP